VGPAEDVGVRGNEFQRAVCEPVEFVDLEPGGVDGPEAIAVEVTTAADYRPRRGDHILENTEQRPAGADMFEEP
jgi:hypothetical protein